MMRLVFTIASFEDVIIVKRRRLSHSMPAEAHPPGEGPDPGLSDSPPPKIVRRAAGILIPEEQIQDRWIWQHADWPAFTWQWDQLVGPLGTAHQALGRLQMASRVLSPKAFREVLAEVLTQEGVSTSAIEGEHINPASMAASVARHLGLPVDSNAPFDRQAEGVGAVLSDAMQNPSAPLSLGRLCRWHRALFPESRPDMAIGMLRPGPVHVETRVSAEESIVHFMAVPRAHLEQELDRFLVWFNSSSSTDGLVRAGMAHLWFVTIHPFDDGNGRITRALTDLALSQAHNTDPIVRMSSRILQVRPDYYVALASAQAFHQGLDITPWLRWFLIQVVEACTHPEQIIQRSLARGTFWARHTDKQINERQRKVLNRLLDAGPGGCEGGMTTRKYVSLTDCSPITASRDLTDLAESGCLLVAGAGRSTHYFIPWDALIIQK
jgi:Fic family protein